MTTTEKELFENRNKLQKNRKKGSQFDQVCEFINSKPIGSTYSSRELRHKCSSVTPQRLGYCHMFILQAKCVERVRRGHYKVLAHLPDFVTYNMLEANRGYNYCLRNPHFRSGDNSQPYYLKIPRGLQWHANEPNPYLTYQDKETIEAPKSTIGEFKEKVNLFFSVKKPGEYLTARTIYGTIVIIITIHSDPDYVLVRYDEEYNKEESIGSFLMRFGEFTSIEPSYSFSAEPESSKKERIVNILKQGLSACDAADLILKLL